MLDSVRCEVLDATYAPVHMVSARRALHMCLRGKAVVLAEHPEFEIVTTHDMFPVPTQIKLHRVVPAMRGNALLTQRNMFVRDKYTCQYCARHKTELRHGEFLTRDHVTPQSKGGKDTWTNVVTACNSCNNKKADHMPEDISMFPAKTPKVPTVFEIRSKSSHSRKKKD